MRDEGVCGDCLACASATGWLAGRSTGMWHQQLLWPDCGCYAVEHTSSVRLLYLLVSMAATLCRFSHTLSDEKTRTAVPSHMAMEMQPMRRSTRHCCCVCSCCCCCGGDMAAGCC